MEEKDILNRIDHNDGLKVPDGYFDKFVEDMTASLPQQPWELETTDKTPAIKPRTFWQTVRPYVYLAAMFAGIWLMMQVFTVGAPQSPDAMISNNPVLSEALDDDSYINDMVLPEEDIDVVYDDLFAQGVSIEDLRDDANL